MANPPQGTVSTVFLPEVHVESSFRTFNRLHIPSTRAVESWGTKNTSVISVRAEITRRTITIAIYLITTLVADQASLACGWDCLVV